jgi:hypothetical protein
MLIVPVGSCVGWQFFDGVIMSCVFVMCICSMVILGDIVLCKNVNVLSDVC